MAKADRKIKILETVEADIEKILGKPMERFSNIGKYETNDGIFTIKYSEGNCKEDIAAKYNVGRGTVIKFNFKPRRRIKFSKLGINTSGFSTSKSGDVFPPTITYDNPTNGISYDVNWKNSLIWVQVYPTDSFYYLKCSN